MFFVYFKLPKRKTADEDKPDTAFGHYHPVSLFSENATESHGLPPMLPLKNTNVFEVPGLPPHFG